MIDWIVSFWNETVVPMFTTATEQLQALWQAKPTFITMYQPVVLQCVLFAVLLLMLFCCAQLLADVINKTKGRRTALMCTMAVSVIAIFIMGGSL